MKTGTISRTREHGSVRSRGLKNIKNVGIFFFFFNHKHNLEVATEYRFNVADTGTHGGRVGPGSISSHTVLQPVACVMYPNICSCEGTSCLALFCRKKTCYYYVDQVC